MVRELQDTMVDGYNKARDKAGGPVTPVVSRALNTDPATWGIQTHGGFSVSFVQNFRETPTVSQAVRLGEVRCKFGGFRWVGVLYSKDK